MFLCENSMSQLTLNFPVFSTRVAAVCTTSPTGDFYGGYILVSHVMIEAHHSQLTLSGDKKKETTLARLLQVQSFRRTVPR